MNLRAITLDLDDTLWPVWPAIHRAEQRVLQWLAEHAPATAAAHDTASLRRIRNAVAAAHPEWAHDLSAMRRESLRQALTEAGDDPALAEPAFDVFFAERQRVELFDDVLPALERLAALGPIVALSNGNADVQRVPGLGRFFAGSLSAREFGVGKPDPAIFHAACRLAGAEPSATLHIGDDAALDIDGALGAGLRAAWVRRPGHAAAQPQQPPHHVVDDLRVLADEVAVLFHRPSGN